MLLTRAFFMRVFLIPYTIITRTDRRVEGWLRRDGWMGGRRVRIRGEYRVSSLVKKKKITLSFTSPEKDFVFNL